MLKKLTIAAASAVTASGFAVAETVASPVGDFDVSMNVGLTSDYIFRGIPQTQGKGAIQGGLDFGLTYTDTSLSDSECEGFATGGKSDYCGANFLRAVGIQDPVRLHPAC